MRYEKLISIYGETLSLIKKDNYEKALKNISICSKAFLFYGKLSYKKSDVIYLIKEIIKQIPEKNINSNYYYKIGVSLYFLGFLKKAKKFLIKAIKSKKNSKYYLSLALIFESMQKKNLMLKSLKKAEEIDKFNIEVLLLKARLREFEGNRDKAIYYYNIALDIDNNNAYPYFMKARCLFLEGEYKSALKELNMAYEKIDEDNFAIVDILTLTAEIYYELKNYKKAFNIFDILDENYKYRPEPYYVKSSIIFSIARENEALNLIDKSIYYSPNMETKASCYYKKAFFLNLMSRTDEAIYYLEKVLKIKNNDIKTLDLYGEILSARSEHQKSIEVFKNRLTIENNTYVNFYIAESYFSLGNYSDSYNYINKFLTEVKDYPPAYLLRAKVNSIQGYKKLAIKDLSIVLNLNDDMFCLYENDLFYLSNLEGMKEFQLFLNSIENRND